jgi:hypothetical protein
MWILSKTFKFFVKSFIKILLFIKRLIRKIGRGEVADMYGCNLDTLRTAMLRHKELDYLKDVRLFFPADLENIFKYLGEPIYVDIINPKDE